MRTMTVSEIKRHGIGNRRGVGGRRVAPTPGGATRRVWDLLQAHKGSEISVEDIVSPDPGQAIRYLQDFYGLDIRRTSRHHYVLVGEWVGGRYVSYV